MNPTEKAILYGIKQNILDAASSMNEERMYYSIQENVRLIDKILSVTESEPQQPEITSEEKLKQLLEDDEEVQVHRGEVTLKRP